MDNYVDERDLKNLENDRYTYFVLGRVMTGKCQLLLSDHKRLIICFTTLPYPVWIWTADGLSEEEKENIYALVKEHFLVKGDFNFNLKYELAEYIIPRAKTDGYDLSIITNMYAYDCPKPAEPSEKTDGQLYQCQEKDIEEVTDFIEMMSNELSIDIRPRELCRREAEDDIARKAVYFWKNGEGKNVASCKYTPNGDISSINLVYTRPEYRRRHYAENLVYSVTKIVHDQELMPMLYTDADYEASNACYEKIGYILRGKLCTIG
ncbi:MAG: GNAT family N-acetyltransferase [Erysipelotrichaceae bacterium]|nr:GNAT family N-acetyltransferase [Erysipelotrichaceae bacterium]